MVYNATFSSHLTQYTDEAVTEMAEDGHKHVMVLSAWLDFLEGKYESVAKTAREAIEVDPSN